MRKGSKRVKSAKGCAFWGLRQKMVTPPHSINVSAHHWSK